MRLLDRGYRYHKVGGEEVEFFIHKLDTASDPQYFGYITIEGVYLIKKYSDADGTMGYYIGTTDFDTDWNNRASLTYKNINKL